MSSTRKPSPPESVRHARDLKNVARNEQQKAIFLSEVARIRTARSSSKLIADSEKLLQQSQRTRQRARQLRSR